MAASLTPEQVGRYRRDRITAVPVRGEDGCGYYDPERRPQADCEPEARAFHEETLANYFASRKELAKLCERSPDEFEKQE